MSNQGSPKKDLKWPADEVVLSSQSVYFGSPLDRDKWDASAVEQLNGVKRSEMPRRKMGPSQLFGEVTMHRRRVLTLSGVFSLL